MASMALFRKPIIATARTSYSTCDFEKRCPSSARAAVDSDAGIAARHTATCTADRLAAARAPPADSAATTSSTVAPRCRANEHECAEQYAHPAVRLAAYMVNPTVDREAPSPSS